MTFPYRKPVHRAKLISSGGRQVSPLCAPTPKALDLRRNDWTLIDGAVDCVACLHAIHAIQRRNAEAASRNKITVRDMR